MSKKRQKAKRQRFIDIYSYRFGTELRDYLVRCEEVGFKEKDFSFTYHKANDHSFFSYKDDKSCVDLTVLPVMVYQSRHLKYRLEVTGEFGGFTIEDLDMEFQFLILQELQRLLRRKWEELPQTKEYETRRELYRHLQVVNDPLGMYPYAQYSEKRKEDIPRNEYTNNQ